MATFSRPQDGILAAPEMLERIQSLQRVSPSGITLGLKPLLHQGPVLAVNAIGYGWSHLYPVGTMR